MLGDEELSVADFVSIFQLEVEGMMISHDHLEGNDGKSSTPAGGDVEKNSFAADGTSV